MSKKVILITEEDIATWRELDRKAVASLSAKCKKLESLESQVLSQLELIRGEKERTICAIAVLEGEESIDGLASAELSDRTEEIGESGERDPNEDVRCGRATIQDIAGCPSQRQAMYVIAERNDGIVDLNQAAALVMAAGMSRSSNARTVSASLHNYLSNNSDFEWFAPSRFRLKSAEEIELTTGDEMALAEQSGNRFRT